MPDIPKGGRGHRASYDTTHMRVPTLLKDLFTRISNDYKMTGNIPELDTENTDNATPDRETMIALAHQLIKSKKGAKHCLEKLLTTLYREDIELS